MSQSIQRKGIANNQQLDQATFWHGQCVPAGEIERNVTQTDS